jgi:hypothetical protein
MTHDPGKREPEHEEGGTAIHPEALGPPEHLKASLEDVIHLFDHGGTEGDEPDIRSDTPAP